MSTKFGLIGAGMMGREHIRNLQAIKKAEIVAIADPDDGSLNSAKELFSEDMPPYYLTDYRQLREFDLDAVIIATPNFTHTEVVKELASTPFHLLVEKPMCTNLRDCKEMIAIDKGRDPMIWIALEYRFMSTTSHFLSKIPEIGDLKMVFIREHRGPFLEKVNNWNRFNKYSGGTLVEKCCHFFDLMTLMVQATPVRVHASGGQNVNHLDEKYDGGVPDILDNAFVIVEFDNGVRGCLDLCMFAEGSRNEQELVATGQLGKIEAFIPEDLVKISFRDGNNSALKIPPNPRIKYMGLHHGASYMELLAFIKAVLNGSDPIVDCIQGLRSVAVGIAAQEAIASGKSTRIPVI